MDKSPVSAEKLTAGDVCWLYSGRSETVKSVEPYADRAEYVTINFVSGARMNEPAWRSMLVVSPRA